MKYKRVRGLVVAGKAEGRSLGYPTANLELDPRSFRPSPGVYACWVEGIEKNMVRGVLVVGVHTEASGKPRVEVHVLDFHGDLYGLPLTVTVVARLRGLIEESNQTVLVAQIEKDITQARELLQKPLLK